MTRNKETPLRAIRQYCLACNGTSNEVKLCPVVTCPIFKHRFGHGRGRYLKAIRAKCLDCAETKTEIRNCPIKDCQLRPYRMGTNPRRKGTGNILRNATLAKLRSTKAASMRL
jgi:hypothetical protein